LVRNGLIEPRRRRRRRNEYVRWEREAPMELWQLQVTASLFLVDGRQPRIVTGLDDHSRFSVLAKVVPQRPPPYGCLSHRDRTSYDPIWTTEGGPSRMSGSSEYRDKMEHLYQDGYVKRDMTAVDDVVHPDYVYHGFAPIGPGPEGIKTYIQADLAGVSDVEVEIEDFFAEGDRAASRLRLAGSHTGVLFGAPATGRRFEVMAHCTYRFKDGKLVEEWETFEEGKMMTALGLLLEPPG
jgi:predicted ester cyclase